MIAPDLDRLRLERLKRTLAAAAVAHPYYQGIFEAQNIDVRAITTLEDLQNLPLTRKEDYTADPESFRLVSSRLSASHGIEERVLWDVTYTTGTTSGRPSPFYNTSHDAYTVWDQARRCSEAEGLVPGDRIGNLYPLANFPTGAFLSVVRTGMILGLPVVHGLTGSANSQFKVRNSLAEALNLIAAFRPTVLWGVPSFVRRFLWEAGQREVRFPELRLIITSGEPMPSKLRNELRSLAVKCGAGAMTVLARYAFTEMQGGLVQCAEDAAPQNICPDLYYLEVVNPADGRRVSLGETGMLAITHLHRRGTVLLRYLVGDIVRLSAAPCPNCGRHGERLIATPRRTGNLVKCRGMLVNTDIIHDIVAAVPHIGEFQIVFKRNDEPGAMDRLIIRLEEAAGFTDQLRSELIEQVQRAVSVRPEIEFVLPGSIYDHERGIKVKRVIDLRSVMD